jgi:hypothetical protein
MSGALNLRHRPGDDFVALTKFFLEAASLSQKIDTQKIVRFIKQFSDGDPIFEHFLEVLIRAGKANAFPPCYKAIKGKKAQEWKLDTLDAFMRTASAQAANMLPELRALKFSKTSAFGSCWLHYKKAKIAVSASEPVRPPQLADKNPE